MRKRGKSGHRAYEYRVSHTFPGLGNPYFCLVRVSG